LTPSDDLKRGRERTALRLDQLLVDRGLFPSREQARRAVMAGTVEVEGRRVDKPGTAVQGEARVHVLAPKEPFVSRAGRKLAHALDYFGLDPAGWVCLDTGASTGGFTDCLLQRGAARVAPVDVAYGQIDLRLREDRRVTVLERLNARELVAADLPFRPELATVDVSFISLRKVLPAVARCLAPAGEVLAMVKPQFELGRERVRKGVVRDVADRREAILSVALAARELGLPVRGFASSGLPGPKGNRETFVWCGGGDAEPVADLEAAVAEVEP
jgi:23S rRNA (cytidine1920-2'-O)/16S rRNA (cytidine1409-2'-O)-methyltransferase